MFTRSAPDHHQGRPYKQVNNHKSQLNTRVISITDTTSVTRWLDYLYNILPIKAKKFPTLSTFCQSGLTIFHNTKWSVKNCKRFLIYFQSGEISPNLVTLDTAKKCYSNKSLASTSSLYLLPLPLASTSSLYLLPLPLASTSSLYLLPLPLASTRFDVNIISVGCHTGNRRIAGGSSLDHFSSFSRKFFVQKISSGGKDSGQDENCEAADDHTKHCFG